MLESSVCEADDRSTAALAEQWWLDPSTNRFHLASEPDACLRYFAEASSFASWSCDDAPPFYVEGLHDAADGGRVLAQRYCTQKAGQAARCLDVSGR